MDHLHDSQCCACNASWYFYSFDKIVGFLNGHLERLVKLITVAPFQLFFRQSVKNELEMNKVIMHPGIKIRDNLSI